MIEDIMEWFDLSREQIITVLDFAARKPHSFRPPLNPQAAHATMLSQPRIYGTPP
jgi:hypothetical protein